MELARMDDIAGCRIIFRGIRQLHQFREELHNARFNHKLRHSENPNKYDYLTRPKASGYRGIHDIYSYDVNSESGADLKGLFIEIQYRTLIQHAWATASEIVGFVTDSQPKFQRGDQRVLLAMSYASEILARAHEGMFGPHPTMSNTELIQAFADLDSNLNIMDALKSLNQATSNQSDLKNFILESLPDGTLRIYAFRDATTALMKLFEFEKDRPQNDIVLVRADSAEEVRLAFRNYFQDARDFVRLVETGRDKLTNRKKARLNI